MHKVRDDRPVGPITKNILRQFNASSQELGLGYFLVGATARHGCSRGHRFSFTNT
jgi:hypothetical protein